MELLLNGGADPLAKTKESKKIALELAKDESVCIINMRFLVRMNLDRLERLEADRTQHRMRLDTLEKISENLKQQDQLLANEIQVTEKNLDQRITEVVMSLEQDLQRSSESAQAEIDRQVARLDRQDLEQEQQHTQLREEHDGLLQEHKKLKLRMTECEIRNSKLEERVSELEPRNQMLELRVKSLEQQLQFVIDRLTSPVLGSSDLNTLIGMQVDHTEPTQNDTTTK